MMGQALHLLGALFGGKCFQYLDDAAVEGTALSLEETLVGHLMRESVFEGVGTRWEKARLVEELNGLQVGEAPAERILGQLRESLEQGARHLHADDGGDLHEMLLLRWQPVEAGGQDG